MFFNTNSTKGEQLKKEWLNASHQEEEVISFFEKNPNNLYTPFEIQKEVFKEKVPITSVRRAITNLTSKDRLLKTDHQKKGVYGKANYCWVLNQ